jgi:hypothetical protein
VVISPLLFRQVLLIGGAALAKDHSYRRATLNDLSPGGSHSFSSHSQFFEVVGTDPTFEALKWKLLQAYQGEGCIGISLDSS